MIPKMLHQTTRSGERSWEEARLAKRAMRLMPNWLHRLWNDHDNRWMMGKYFPQFAERFDAIGFGVAKADIARYAYMHIYGGFYIDTDYKLLRAFDDDLLAARCVIPLEAPAPEGAKGRQQYLALGNAVFGSEAEHPFWAQLIAHIFDHNRPHEMTDRHAIIPATGPRAVTRFFAEREADFPDIALPESALFYPPFGFSARISEGQGNPYGVHLTWGSWHRRSPITSAKALARRKLNGLLS